MIDAILWFQSGSHRLTQMVLEHFSEQVETSALGWEQEDESAGVALKLTETDWSRIVEKFCGLSITEATRPRLCHDVEIISSGSVKSLAGGSRSSQPSPADLADADYVALHLLDRKEGTNGRMLWMTEACPVTQRAMFVH